MIEIDFYNVIDVISKLTTYKVETNLVFNCEYELQEVNLAMF